MAALAERAEGHGKGSKRHPNEGNKARNQKNGRNAKGDPMTCYDCGSEYHLVGSPECEHHHDSLFARADTFREDYAGLALAVDDPPFNF